VAGELLQQESRAGERVAKGMDFIRDISNARRMKSATRPRKR
jgi:hypothetical protein